MKRIAFLLLSGLAACGGGGAGGSGLRGSVVVDGSSTVAPISEAVAEEFNAEEPRVRVSVGTSGTGGGFKRFCAGEIDLADASRAIKDEEKRACADNGVEFVELLVALDGLAVVTSTDTKFLSCLSFEQLRRIFEDGGASRWRDVDPAFPDENIDIFAPGTDSGTYDFFVEEVLGEDVKPRTDYQASEDDNTIVQGIQGEEGSWGFFGFAYFKENREGLKAIRVSEEPGGECVVPNDETVRAGEYPLSRPLYIYAKKASLEKPAVREFVRFYLDVAPELVGYVGYTPAPAADYTRGLEQIR
ncbi:MAG TPA: PstS family phosphate ABC transporter substrate-binding protein [Acidimicrobiales bacterium]|nr:PstS family phosphate ABC transporter substrate-binding protein [Acidimicrobiales bacterium]